MKWQNKSLNRRQRYDTYLTLVLRLPQSFEKLHQKLKVTILTESSNFLVFQANWCSAAASRPVLGRCHTFLSYFIPHLLSFQTWTWLTYSVFFNYEKNVGDRETKTLITIDEETFKRNTDETKCFNVMSKRSEWLKSISFL